MTRRERPPITTAGRLHPTQSVDGSADPLDEAVAGPTLEAGALIGNYVVDELRSTGGFAAVYRVHHLTLGRRAAVKVLHRHLSTSPVCVRRFIQEAQAVNVIGHRNIVDIYEFGELSDGRPFCVMEWLEGMDLHERIARRGPFSLAEGVHVLEQVCVAVAAAHRAGIVHRDLKAANVFLVERPDGSVLVKLLDFGIAKLLGDDGTRQGMLTSTGTRLGTPWTMSPEQILGAKVDGRADIYSLGVMLYQMLTGQLPFRASTALQVEEMHLHAPPPLPSQAAGLPQSVDTVVERCMRKEPEKRYATVEELLAALRGLVTPRARGRVERAQGVSIYFAAKLSTDVEDFADELLDQLDATMERVRERLREAELALVIDGATSLLAVRVLASVPEEARREREQCLDLAQAVRASVEGGARSPALRGFSIVVHAAPLLVRRTPQRTEFLGGELLSIADWADAPLDCTCATASVLSGLEGTYASEAISSHPSLCSVRPRRNS